MIVDDDEGNSVSIHGGEVNVNGVPESERFTVTFDLSVSITSATPAEAYNKLCAMLGADKSVVDWHTETFTAQDEFENKIVHEGEDTELLFPEQCAACGKEVPRGEAFFDAHDVPFCSEEHRREKGESK